MSGHDKIYIGSVDDPTLTFDVNSIETIVCENAVDAVGNELSSDILEVGVFFDDQDDTLKNLDYGTSIFYYNSDKLVGKYYLTTVTREGVKKYLIRATTLVGLIEQEDFYGNFYDGDRFEDVLDDILFTDSMSLTKLKVYSSIKESTGTGSYEPVLIYGVGQRELRYWNYRMHVEFTVTNPSFSESQTSRTQYVCGFHLNSANANGQYYVSATARRANTTSPVNWYITAYYYRAGGGTGGGVLTLGFDTALFGTGTKFIADIDPRSKTMSLKAEYIKYDDQTVTGVAEASKAIPDFVINDARSTNIPCHLGYAFGAAYSSSQSGTGLSRWYWRGLQFHQYQVYDESGNMIINAVPIIRERDQQRRIVNTVTGLGNNTSIPETMFDGEIGWVGGFTRFERDIELNQHIQFGAGVADILVYGWINKCTKREALHQLLFAENISLLKTDTGDYLFTMLDNSHADGIDEAHMYDDSEEEFITGARLITLTEHSFEPNDTAVQIFDNTTSPLIDGQYLAVFNNAPIYGTPVGNGITIIGYNSNAALVTGRGTISGTAYSHSQRVIRRTNPTVTNGADVSVSNNGLITGMNSDNIMNRMLSYYSGDCKKITNSIVFDGEKCGRKYSFKTLFRDNNSGFLTKLSATASSFVKAICTFVTGFVPPKISGYSGYQISTYNTSWTVPSDVRAQEYPSIRITLIGKGYQGATGENGKAGEEASEGEGNVDMYGGEGGDGGKGGEGGKGGLIYVVTLDATNINRVDVSKSGQHTIVKTYNDSGTLLNTYSSASGNSNDLGFTNVFTGVVYARKGATGVDGGKGGTGGSSGHPQGRFTYFDGTAGENVEGGVGGPIVHNVIKSYFDGSYWFVVSYYGGGGGAAYNANGSASQKTGEDSKNVYTIGGKGANAGAARVVYTEYGSGGSGGNGGGGGGGSGTRYDAYGGNIHGYTYKQTPGLGGTGSVGAEGIDGCAIIYY